MSAVIFDFDGTIADSFDYVSDLMARKAGQPGLSLAARQKRFAGLSIRGMMFELHKSHLWGLWLFFYGRREMTGHLSEIKIFPGMDEVIKKLHDMEYQLFILSSNRNINVRLLLDRYELTRYFVHTQGNASILGKGIALRWLLWRHRLNPRDCTVIGDEIGDLDAAKSLAIRDVAVTWGYNAADALKARQPSAIVSTPHELLNQF
jgi:phosphoglycolate phosphatase